MKKARRKSRSRSPTKRAVRFQSGGREVTVASPVLPYVRRVRRALSSRPDDYREFVDVLSSLRRPAATFDNDATVISRLERAVSLLDGHPELISALRMFLPSHCRIDVQSDAVVVKVTASEAFMCRASCDIGLPRF